MKIRKGFVSNSSSSSFIIHKSYLTKTQVKEIESLYNELVVKEEIWDDNGTYFQNDVNYIQFNANGGDGRKKLDLLLEEFGVSEDKILQIQG
jgi:hypothetical protein